MHFAILLQGGFAAKRTTQQYFADIIRTFPWYSHYLHLLFLKIQVMCTLMCCVDNGLEMKLWALSICCATQNDLAPEVDASALFTTIFVLVNVIPFPGLKTLLATFMHTFIPHNGPAGSAAASKSDSGPPASSGPDSDRLLVDVQLLRATQAGNLPIWSLRRG